MTLATCTISGAVAAADGSAVAKALVRVRLVAGETSGSVATGPAAQLTGADGSWSVTLPQGASYRLEIPATEIDHLGVVPRCATADFADLAASMLPFGYDLGIPLDPTELR